MNRPFTMVGLLHVCLGIALCSVLQVSAATDEISDARGWIHVPAFKVAVERISALPSGGFECYVEGDPDEQTIFSSRKEQLAYERSRREQQEDADRIMDECETERAKQQATFEQARTAFNKTWKPAIQRAAGLGDPVAGLILLSCATAPWLDRDSVSDCSAQESGRKLAMKRLAGLGFRPVLMTFVDINEAEYRRPCAPGNDKASEMCRAQATIQRYKRMLDVMESGYLGVAEYWNRCPVKYADKALDLLAEECQRLFFLTRAVVSLAPRAYVDRLTLWNSAFPGGTDQLDPHRVTRLDWSRFSDPHFQARFDADVSRILGIIEKNIEQDLRADRRWDAFIVSKKLSDRIPPHNQDQAR